MSATDGETFADGLFPSSTPLPANYSYYDYDYGNGTNATDPGHEPLTKGFK